MDKLVDWDGKLRQTVPSWVTSFGWNGSMALRRGPT